MREKKIYCGDKYMEVDIFPYSKMQKEISKGKRSKKRKESAPKQKNLNDKNSRRYFTQLVNSNFGLGDYHVTATYKDEFLPETLEDAEREVTNYLRRINYRREKEGLIPLEYILVTEYNTEENGEKPIRIHHHIIINGGLNRDTIEDLWSRRRKKGEKKGESIGFINVDRLQPDENGVSALCRYLTKRPCSKKRWTSSHNLKKPWYRNNDHKYRRREIEKICKSIPDSYYWEKKYPGWKLANNDYSLKAVYNDITGWSIYLKMIKLE
ncbi:rolling circle replication-associated protein [Clostridium coskatii]|nr:hypothetical protein [Clostridium coskatii]